MGSPASQLWLPKVDKSIEKIKNRAIAELETISTIDGLKDLTIRYLGRKGLVTLFLRDISKLPEKERPAAGKKTNQVKHFLKEEFKKAEALIAGNTDRAGKGIDVSLPGRPAFTGSFHPVSLITDEISDIFIRLGFSIAEGPEVETDYYNFEALNFPKNHPARQDPWRPDPS